MENILYDVEINENTTIITPDGAWVKTVMETILL